VPDFGLTEALQKALAASKSVPVMRPAEQALASSAAKAAPEAAPASVARAPMTGTPPDAVAAPPINPSQPAPDVPPPAASAAATDPAAAVAPPDVQAGGAGAAPPTGALAASQPAPQADLAPTPKGTVPVASKLPAASGTPDNVIPFLPKGSQLVALGEDSMTVRMPDGSTRSVAIPDQFRQQPAPPEWAQEYEEASRRQIQKAAQSFVHANLSEFEGRLDMTHMPNVDTMSSPDGVRAAILQVADDNKAAIEAARGTAASNDQLIGLAQDLGVNADQLKQTFDREFGPVAETDSGDQRRAIVLSARMIEQNEAGTILALADKVAGGTASPEEIARFEQHGQAMLAWRTRLAGVSAERGRDLQAMSIPVGLPPQVMEHIADVLSRANPDMQATAAAIKLAGTPQGIANILGGLADKPLWQRAPLAAFNMLQRVFINGILSGPPTWLKIFTGNNLNLALNQFDLYTAGIGRGMYGMAARLGGYPTAQEGVQLSDAVAHMHGVISAGADALRVAGRVMKTGQSMDTVLRAGENAGKTGGMTTGQILAPELNGSYFQGIVKVIDNIIDAPGSRVIAGIDDFTKTIGFRGYVTMMSLREIRARMLAGTLKPGDAEQVVQDMMRNYTPEMGQAAEDWAHRMTFQSAFPEGGAGEAFQNFLNKAPALRFIFPFMRTATNIFKQSVVERTPLALFSARIRSQIAAGGFEGDLAKARIATGTALGSMFAWMAIHDRITGDAPKDAKERMVWEQDGRTPYSIRVTNPITGKDTWRSYAWLEPIATTAGAVADAVALKSYMHTDDDSLLPHDVQTDHAIAHIMASIIQNTGNKTFMQGAAQFSEMYNDPQRAFGMWADQMAANLQPFSGATKFARNMQDPYMRQAFTIMDKVRDQLPSVFGVKGSQTLPARLDVFGNARTRSGDNNILGPLNPLPGSSSKKDTVNEEITSLMDKTSHVPISMPTKLMALLGGGRGVEGGSGMRLTPEEYNDFVQKARATPVFDNGTKTLHEKLEEMIASPNYQKMSPAERFEFFNEKVRAADKAGAQLLFKDNVDFRERMLAWTAEKNRIQLGQ
jgi:hypothetical protein